MASVKLTFIGHSSFRFESERGTVIYFDAWLDDNPTAKMKLSSVRKADVVIATHGHMDHIGDSFEICKRTRAKFVGSYELCLVAQTYGLKKGSRVLSMNPGGSVKVKDATMTMTQAHHSISMSPHVISGPQPEGLLFHPDSVVGGFAIAFDSGITIYDSSDTCVFSDMQLIGQMYGPQIAILPVGGQYTMGVREAARAASFIRPDIIIPCHYGEIMGQPADIDELSREVRFLSPNTRVVPLKPGQSMTYTASSFKISR